MGWYLDEAPTRGLDRVRNDGWAVHSHWGIPCATAVPGATPAWPAVDSWHPPHYPLRSHHCDGWENYYVTEPAPEVAPVQEVLF